MKIEIQRPTISVSVFIIYDTVHAGLRAKELCDRLQQRLGPEYKLNLNLWNLAILSIPSLAQAALETVMGPGLLIMAVKGDATLPPFIRSQVSRYIRKTRVTNGVIAVQLHGVLKMEQELAPAYQDLERIARSAGLEFFSEAASVDNDLGDYIETIHVQAHMGTPVLEAIPAGVF